MTKDAPATTPFQLPDSWEAMPYGEHWSFAYTTERGEREDYDFRIEFNEGVCEVEERAVIGLLEAAPKLLAFAKQIARMTKDGEEIDGREFVMENDGAVDTVNDLIESARHLVVEAGRAV